MTEVIRKMIQVAQNHLSNALDATSMSAKDELIELARGMLFAAMEDGTTTRPEVGI